jgi:hypothetical protein
MRATATPQELEDAFMRARTEGAKCVLISGGFDRKGRLPISSFITSLAKAKRETGLRVEAHLGLLDAQDFEILGKAGIDALLLDVVGDQGTIDGYLGGTWRVEDYARVLKTAKVWIPSVSAHVLIGVDGGQIKGEYKAIDIAAREAGSLAILLPMEKSQAPEGEETERVMMYARDRVRSHLTLGCMRGIGRGRLAAEKLAVELGFDGIANPAKETINYAKSRGLATMDVEGCCTFAPYNY